MTSEEKHLSDFRGKVSENKHLAGKRLKHIGGGRGVGGKNRKHPRTKL